MTVKAASFNFKHYDSLKLLLVAVLTRLPNDLVPFITFHPYLQIVMRAFPLIYPAAYFIVINKRAACFSLEVEGAEQKSGFKSFNGKFIRHYSSSKNVVLVPPRLNYVMRWKIKDFHGKVKIGEGDYFPEFLSGNSDGSVSIGKDEISTKWTPFKNEDGSWSFMSASGGWLSSHREDGVICTVLKHGECQRFIVYRWGEQGEAYYHGRGDEKLEAAGKYSLKSINDKYVRALPEENDCRRMDLSPNCTPSEHWRIEPFVEGYKQSVFGLVLIKSNHYEGAYLHCYPDGSVGYAKPFNDEITKWMPHKHKYREFSFESTSGEEQRWLSVNEKDGFICTVLKQDKYSRFKLCPWGDAETLEALVSAKVQGAYSLKSDDGMYVQARQDGSWKADSSFHSSATTFWHIEDCEGTVAIKSEHVEGQYLGCNPDNSVDYNKRGGKTTKWTPLQNENGSWSFKSASGRWLSVHEGDGVLCTTSEIKEKSEQFRLCSWGDRDEVAVALSSEVEGAHSLRSFNGMYVRANQRGNWRVDMTPYSNASEFWYIEDHHGTIIFKSNHVEGRYMSCNSDDSIDYSKHRSEATEWMLFKNEDESWSFMSSKGRWLSAHRKDGFICTAPHNKKCQRFMICPRGDPKEAADRHAVARSVVISEELTGQRCIKAYNGIYVQFRKDGSVSVDLVPHDNKSEFWHIEDHQGTVGIRAPQHTKGQYLSCNSDGTVDYNQFEGDTIEWTPFKNEDDSWSFLSWSGRWLSADSDERIICTMPDNDKCERFTLCPWLDGEFSLKSCYGTYMQADKDNEKMKVDLAKKCSETTGWHFEDLHGTIRILHNRYKSSTNQYLSCNSDGSIECSKETGPVTEWTPLKNEDGSWSFKSSRGLWLSARGGSRVSTNPKNNDKSERFTLCSWDDSEEADTRAEILGPHSLRLYRQYVHFSPAAKVYLAEHCTESAFLHIEDQNGKVALKSNHGKSMYLNCNLNGSVDFKEDKGDTTEWTPFKDKYGKWSFRSLSGRWLSTHGGDFCAVFNDKDHFNLCSWGDPEEAQQLKLPINATRCRYIKSFNRKYMRILPDFKVDLVSVNNPMEDWKIMEGDMQGTIRFKSMIVEGKYLSSNPDGSVDCKDGGETTLWIPTSNLDASSSFLSSYGRWLSARSEDGFMCTMPYNETCERFTLIECSNQREERSLSSEVSGVYTIKTISGQSVRAPLGDGSWTANLASHLTEFWLIESFHEKVRFASSRFNGQYLNIHPEWDIEIQEFSCAEEAAMFTPIKNDDGSWSFNSVRTISLRSLDGVMSTWWTIFSSEKHFKLCPWDVQEDDQQDLVVQPSEEVAGVYRLQSFNGMYMRSQSNDKWNVGLTPHFLERELWHIENHNGTVRIKSNNGQYLCCDSEGSVDFNDGGETAEWTPVKGLFFCWSFRSASGRWLSACREEGNMTIDHGYIGTVEHDEPSEREQFAIESWTEERERFKKALRQINSIQ